MSTLTQFQNDDQAFQLMQNSWSSQINPIINRAQNQSNILKKIALINGTTVVNHLLGKNLNGWKIVRQRASASIYDAQDTNQTPNLTLVLISSAAVVVDIEVF